MMDLMRGIFIGFKDVFDYFLDTTPRTHFKKMMELIFSIFKIENRALFIFLMSSFVLHFLLVLPSMSFFRDWTESLTANGSQVTSSDEKNFSKLVAENEALQVTGVFYFNGTEKPKKTNPTLSPTLSHLLAKFNRQSKSWNMGAALPVSQAQASIQKTNDKKVDWAQKSEETKKNVKVSSEASSLEKNLSRSIAKHNPQFQNCYENALLKDPTISGKIAFDLTIGTQGKIANTKLNFDGQGASSSLQTLEDCLKTVTNRIQLPSSSQDLIGKQIQFYVMLKAN